MLDKGDVTYLELYPYTFRRVVFVMLTAGFLALMLIALWAGLAIWPRAALLVPFCIIAITIAADTAWTSARWLLRRSHITLDKDRIRVAIAGEHHEFLWSEIERVGFAGGVWLNVAILKLKRNSPAMRLEARRFLFGFHWRPSPAMRDSFALPPLWGKRDLQTIAEFHARFANAPVS